MAAVSSAFKRQMKSYACHSTSALGTHSMRLCDDAMGG